MLYTRGRRGLDLRCPHLPTIFQQHVESQVFGKTDAVLVRIGGEVKPEFEIRLSSAFSTLVQSRDHDSDEWLRRRYGILRLTRVLIGPQFIGVGSLLTLTTAKTDLMMDLDGMISIMADTGKRLLFHHLGQRLRRVLAADTNLVGVKDDGQQLTGDQRRDALFGERVKPPEPGKCPSPRRYGR